MSFGNELARNVVILDVDNSSSSHTDNRKINFLPLGEGPTHKKCLILHYNVDES